MGIICSKGLTSNDYDNQRDIRSSKSSRRLVSSSRRDDVVVEVDGNGGSDGRVRLIAKPQENAGPGPRSFNEGKKRVLGDGPKKDFPVSRKLKEEEKNSKVYRMLNGIEGEHIAAGWPSWLASVAGEAIRGWVPRKADSFEKLDKIGQGTYSNVYRARDLETGKIVALKKVRFANMDPESVRFMAREIHILRSLSHSNIVKLEGLVTSRMSSSLYLIFEYMEHDLAGLAAIPGHKFTEPQVKCFMYQLLCGLDHCHTHGILHRDIKGSNLLVDNNGILRIADFGLATFFHPDQKNPLTSRVVTLWYRPPELLLGATDYGVSVDMWSAGCILAELLAGKPIMPGRTEVEQLHKIFKLCGSPSEEYWAKSKLPHATIFKPQHPYKRCVAETFKDFPPSALALLDVLLAIDPANRGTAVSALKSEFFTTKPLPCDPSSLPKYPPSKELDAKLRDEARRQRAAALKGHGSESGQRGSRESKAVPAPEANAEMRTSLKKWQVYSNSKSNSEKYSTPDDTSSGFPMEPRRGIAQNTLPYSGFQNSNALGFSRDKKTREEEKRTTSGRISGSFKISNSSEEKIQRSYGTQSSNTQAGGKGVKVDGQREIATHWSEQSFNGKYNQTDAAESSDKQEWAHHLLDRPTSSHKKNEKRNGKESTTGPRKHRIHYSGPLLPPGGNMEEMLKEHERQIQQAVRRARHDKVKPKKKYAEKDQLEALLYPAKNGSADIL